MSRTTIRHGKTPEQRKAEREALLATLGEKDHQDRPRHR